jgi:hypothetical protein
VNVSVSAIYGERGGKKNIIFVDFVVKPMVLWRKGGCTLFSLLLKLPKLIKIGVVWIVTFGFCWLLTIAFFIVVIETQ